MISVPTNNEYKEFLSKYHLQGHVGASVKLGLYSKTGNLVSTMGFVSRGNKTYELNRFCLPYNIRVVGAANKLFKHSLDKLTDADKIISFSDNRWSAGNIYTKLGFVADKHINPDYHYFQLDDELLHKSNFRIDAIKSKLGPMLPNETEYQAMLRFKYHRIWDCGKVRWTYTPPGMLIASNPTTINSRSGE